MNRYPRYVLIIFSVTLTIALPGLAIYIAATFDPNAYKPQIIQLVKEKNQRDLKLDGDIKLTFFPRLGAEINGLSLSEYQNDEEFASAENILVSLAFFPLLRKQLELDEIVVTGLKANLIRFTDGHTNIDDLLVKSDEAKQFKFDVGRVRAEKSTLIFRDEVSQKQYIFGDLNLKADKIDVRSSSVDDVIRSKLKLTFRMNQPEQPEIDQAIRLSFDLTLDAANQYYAVSGLNLESKGTINGISHLVINSTGDFSARFAAAGAVGDEFTVTGLTLGMTGISGGNNLDMQLDAPRLSLNGKKVASEGIVAVLKIIGSGGNTNGNFSLSGVNGTISDFRSSALTVELESHKKERVVKAMLASPLAGSVTAQQLDLPDLVATIDADSFGASDGLRGNLKGSASVDGLAQNAQMQFNGRLGGSDIKGNLEASGLTPGLPQPVLNFLVDIGQLDLDRFLAPQQKQQGARKFTKKVASTKRVDETLDLSLFDDLEDLNIQGSIRIGVLKAANVTSSGVKLNIRTGQYRDHH
ncbi:AsmA protein [Nitrosospira sp. Nsp11]|uniref:AsmA family protein n=1 Tax=Nitrosospira sp. Nsp11 TaxID=1855338 RepID=UPI00091DB9EF|nr:AsmA family protein [Nitrosospira sp. Nsp11]SHM21071.1 AsmA protein [Nitrosospira sp. Nsp11]